MRKWVLVLMMVGLCATMASAAGGLGIFGSYWDTKDLGPGFGGGVKFSGDLTTVPILLEQQQLVMTIGCLGLVVP